MASETSIANRALRLIKAGRITSRTEPGSKNADVVNDVYDAVRDELLRDHQWNFNKELAKLARSGTTPAHTWDFGFVLPADWIRTYTVHDNDGGFGSIRYEEGLLNGQNVIYADRLDIYISYGRGLTDPNLMRPDFHLAQAYALAVAMPGISTRTVNETDALGKEAARRLTKAKSSDALGAPLPRRPRGSWAESRGGWRARWPATG